MQVGVWLRRAFFAFAALLLAGSLVGIFLTGPVVVRSPRFADLHVDPSPGRMRSTVERMCFEFSPRDPGHPANLDRLALWIRYALQDAGLEVELQEYTVDGERHRNVIGKRPGTDPDAGAIVLGAHYDSVEGTPGANDNASGIAVLLELVRTLPPATPRRTHYFAAFDTQEPPFLGTDAMGSHAFAARLHEEAVPVELMVSLDLVGYYSTLPGERRFPSPWFRLLYPDRVPFVAVLGDLQSGSAIERVKRGMLAAGRLPVRSLRAPASSRYANASDQWSFRRYEMPAVQITDTAFLRYPYHHTADDTPDKLDYETMAELVRSLHGLLWEGD